MKVKLCGFKDRQSVLAAINAQADFIGFVFCPKSPRYVTPEKAAEIASIIPPTIAKVAVLANIDLEVIKHIYRTVKPDYFQFHGSETPRFLQKIREIFPRVKIIKAFRIANRYDLRPVRDFEREADFFLFDSKVDTAAGGTGQTFDWKVLFGFRSRKSWFLSGGLNASNVLQAAKITGTRMVDVSSGIEKTLGEKSPELITELMTKVKGYAAQNR
ncbi:MAG: phosphoribosylanthranilate isomerase [Rickettsiales bacterium]|nr:phosphoribosylanthranilate isomerase [Rickettsiales bacterium]